MVKVLYINQVIYHVANYSHFSDLIKHHMPDEVFRSLLNVSILDEDCIDKAKLRGV